MNNEKIISELHDEFVRYKQREENDWDSQEELLEFGKFCYQEAQKHKDDEIKENNCAWCPDCGDLLKIKQDKLNPNENWIYYCEGCEQEFEIVGRSLRQQLSDVNKIIDDAKIRFIDKIKHCGNLTSKYDYENECYVKDDSNAIIVLEYFTETFNEELKSKINSLSKGDAPKDDTQLNKGGVNKHGNN